MKSKEEAKLETFGFKSKHHPDQLRELEDFQFELPQSKRISNKRSELISKYCYVKKFLLSNYKSNDKALRKISHQKYIITSQLLSK